MANSADTTPSGANANSGAALAVCQAFCCLVREDKKNGDAVARLEAEAGNY
jgi:hypothetical protein